MANLLQKVITGITQRSVKPTKTAGFPGFSNISGFIQEIEKDQSLVGREKYTVYSNVLVNTSIVAAGVRYFLNLIAKSEWFVSPADDSPEAKELAEFIEKAMHDMDTPWSRIIRRASMYRFYGFSIQEWTAKTRDDGRIGFLDIEPRPHSTIERWDTDEQGDLKGVIQRSPQTQKEVYLPIEKLVYVIDDAISDNPEGLGIFRHLVKPAQVLKRYEQLEGFGFETDLRGTPIAHAPLGEIQDKLKTKELSSNDANSMLNPIRDFIRNHIKTNKLGLMLDSSTYRDMGSNQSPSGSKKWEVDILKGSGNSAAQGGINNSINRINHELARLIGVEQLLLGADGSGTQALSRDKSHNFFLIVDSSLSELREVFNKEFIDVIWRLNGLNDDLKPKFKTETVRFKDIEQITTALRDMASAGAMLEPDDPAINEIRELLGLSTIDLEARQYDAALTDDINSNILPDGDENDNDGL